jgi:hypothetical protein
MIRSNIILACACNTFFPSIYTITLRSVSARIALPELKGADFGPPVIVRAKGSRNPVSFILNPEAEWSNREVLNAELI